MNDLCQVNYIDIFRCRCNVFKCSIISTCDWCFNELVL